MTTKEKFLTARTHIQAKEYDEARAILATIDHPKAREWIQRIDSIQPVPEVNDTPRNQSRRGIFVGGVLVLSVLLVALGFGVIVSSGNLILPDVPLALQEFDTSRTYPLTEYFPSDTTVYAIVRVDDAQIQTLDTLFLHIQSFIRSPLTTPFLGEEPFSFSQSLDQMTDVIFEDDFQTSVRSWLGDWVAMGVFNLDLDEQKVNMVEDVGTLIVVEITDRERAVEFVEQLTDFDPYQSFTRLDSDVYTIFTSNEQENNNILVGDDVLMIATDYAMTTVQSEIADPISANPAFIETMALLPEDKYSVTTYFDFEPIARSIFTATQSLQEDLMDMMAQNPNSDFPAPTMLTYEDMLPEGITMDDAMSALGDLAIGFTIVDDYTLMIDGVQNPGNVEIMESLNMAVPDLESVDPSFLRHVPNDVAFFMHGTDIKSQVGRMLATEQMQLDILERNPELLEQYRQFGLTTSQDGIDRIDAIIEPETGFTVMDDIFGWMTGDYVIFANYDPHHKSILFGYYYPEEELRQNLETGMIIEITDRNHVQNLIDSLGSAIPMVLNDMELTVTTEVINGNSVAVVHVPARDLLKLSLDIVIGVNDDVLVIATRESATKILTGQGGFDESPGYLSAQTRILENADALYYMGNAGVNLFADMMVGVLPPYFERMITDLNSQLDVDPPPPIVDDEQRKSLPLMIPPMRMMLSMFESVTISASVDDNYHVNSRFTLTFAD